MSKRIKLPLKDLLKHKIMFYDLETDSPHAPYCTIKTIAVQYGLRGEPEMAETKKDFAKFARWIKDDEVIKVDFNGNNFDSIALVSNGYEFSRVNHVDLFLALKTMAPSLPAFSLKFANFYFFKDPHFPEMQLDKWCRANNRQMHEAPLELLNAYNKHDVTQTSTLFRMVWPIITRDEFWPTFTREMEVGYALEQIELEGGAVIDCTKAATTLQILQRRLSKLVKNIQVLTDGAVTNPFSAPQLGKYFNEEENVEMKLTDGGEFSVNKKLIASLLDTSPVARAVRELRKVKSDSNFLGHFISAADDYSIFARDKFIGKPANWIPVQVSQSTARTRRFTSSSMHKINWQNLDKNAKSVIVPPEGYIWWGIDLSQIENIVHIFYSKDEARRVAYEADPDWNEYVWLCNQILGENYSKIDLEGDAKTGKKGMQSKEIPGWTVYKQYKTGKLGMNFGMGVRLFCETFGLETEIGKSTFSTIHAACPAIKRLQDICKRELVDRGFVEDPFGFRYAGPVDEAYKVVAYWVQGCGTGSLPKQMLISNYKTLRKYDKFAKFAKSGLLSGTTHDEISGLLNLSLGSNRLYELLEELMFNMTDKYSPRFDDIPIRAKLSLSRTNVAEAIELDMKKDRHQIIELLKA